MAPAAAPHYPDAPTIAEMLAAQARRLGDRPFLTVPDGTLGFAALDDAGRRFAAALAALGYGPGEGIAVLAGNSTALVTAWCACSTLGALFMPINTLLAGDHLAAVLAHARVRLVVCDRERFPALRAVRERLPRLRHVVLAAWPAAERQPRGTLAFERLVSAASPLAHPCAAPREAPGKLLYTSGTTGRPKGVLWSRACESTWAAAYAAELLPVAEGDGLYTCLPLTHVTGQGTVLAALWNGAHVTVDARFDPFSFWRRTCAANARAVTFVGTILAVLAQRPPRPDDRDNPVEWIVGAAAPVRAWRAIEARFGVRIVETWGQTETASCWTAPAALPQQPGTVGRPGPRFEATIVDEAGGPVAHGAVGELWMRPRYPQVMYTGYLHEQDRACWTADGWYRTGDLMSETEAGDLVFHARLREAIRRRGELISARAIEEAALTLPGVAEAAAVGVRAPDGMEEEVKLCLVPAAGAALSEDSVAAQLVPLLPAFMRPRYLQIRASLPKTASSRVRKVELAAEGARGSWSRRG